MSPSTGSSSGSRRWRCDDDGYVIPAQAGMTGKGGGNDGDGVGSRFRGNDAAPGGRGRRGAARPVYGAVEPEWIPAYAGMTKECTNVTMREDGMEVSEREQARRPETGRYAHRLPILPEATSFPRKREPTPSRPQTLRAPSLISPRASSFPRKREPTPSRLAYAQREPTHLRPPYAKAGTYPIAPRPHRAPSAVPSPAAFAASSPLIGRGGIRRLRARMGAGFPPTRE